MEAKNNETNKAREKAEPDLKLEIWTLLFTVIGFIASWINMIFILEAPRAIEVLAFLSIIITTILFIQVTSSSKKKDKFLF